MQRTGLQAAADRETAIGRRRHTVRKLRGIAFLFATSALFVLFQGGKLSTAVFLMVSVLCAYVLSGRWSGIERVEGSRTLAPAARTTLAKGGDRPFSGSLEAGSSLAVRIRVRIPGVWPVPYVIVRDRLIRRGGFEMPFETSLVPDWRRQGEATYETPPLRRGFYRFGRTECWTEDVFGLFEHRGWLDLSQSFAVLPKTAEIRQWQLLHRWMRGSHVHTAVVWSQRETTQINGVREYIYGDRVSRIHWNATAKTGTWKSKEFEREALPRTWIVLDRRGSVYRSEEEFELAVSVVASLLLYLARRDLAVGLLSVGRKTTVFEPARRAASRREVWEHLIEAEADGSGDWTGAVRETTGRWPSGSFAAVVTPVGESPAAVADLFRKRGVNTCFIGLAVGRLPEEADRWRRLLAASGTPGYRVESLEQLPAVLEERVR